jgi:hypothetical protein
MAYGFSVFWLPLADTGGTRRSRRPCAGRHQIDDFVSANSYSAKRTAAHDMPAAPEAH